MIELGRYDGGKGQIFRHLINQMPPHDVYVAAFAGSDAVAMNKRPAKLNILIDMDRDVITAWVDHIVKNGGAAVSPDSAMLPATPSELTMAAVAAAIVDSDDNTWLLMVGDSVEIIPGLQLGRRSFVYADPPYLMSTRGSKRPLYRYELCTDDEHRQMIAVLNGLQCPVMLSGYFSSLYGDLLGDWRVDRFRAVVRSGRSVWEYIWCNYREPLRLHDYSFLGDDFRERERIKRKAGRWVNRFESLPVLERRAIIHELESVGVF